MCGRNIEKMMGGVVLTAVTLSLFMVISAMPLALAQERPGFSVQPGDFVVSNAPPLGEPYRLETKLRINNGDNIRRTFVLSVLVPENLENPKSLENLPLQYEAIPDPRWVIPMAPGGGQEIEIDENSSSVVDIWLNIPYQENLTNKRWEAWISVRRKAEVGEVLEPELICKMWINTSAELPPPPKPTPPFVLAIFALSMAVAIALLVLWLRRRIGVKRKIVLRSQHLPAFVPSP
jgi:hypothetical protein